MLNFFFFLKKLSLKEKSNLRVKNWPNTLEAKRKKKDEARFERFKNEEVNSLTFYFSRIIKKIIFFFKGRKKEN